MKIASSNTQNHRKNNRHYFLLNVWNQVDDIGKSFRVYILYFSQCYKLWHICRLNSLCIGCSVLSPDFNYKRQSKQILCRLCTVTWRAFMHPWRPFIQLYKDFDHVRYSELKVCIPKHNIFLPQGNIVTDWWDWRIKARQASVLTNSAFMLSICVHKCKHLRQSTWQSTW